MRRFYYSATILIVFFIGLVQPVRATDYFFNPHFIISDDEFTQADGLTLAQIQQFLVDQKSGLAFLRVADYQGIVKSAAEIIWQASEESQINPKVLLTTLQKEQSLITGPFFSQNQLDKAMGYRCPDNDVCNPKASGFGKQVDGAAWQYRQYINNPTDWTFQINKPALIDGWLITPLSNATAGLYNYTPHYSGNEHFFKIWVNYWGKHHPDGSLLKAKGESSVWLIEYGQRRPIVSYGVLISRFDPKKIITVTKADLEKYAIGRPIRFSNYSLLGTPSGDVYLLVDDELRHITSPTVFRTLGFNWEEVEAVSADDLIGYQLGQDVTVDSAYPTGALLQNKVTAAVFFVEDGIKKPIIDRDIMRVNFSSRVITVVAPEILDQYILGDPVPFRDGELIKSATSSEVFVIANGQRRWIKDGETFDSLGYQWNNIRTVSAQAVAIHPLGDPLE